MSHSKLAIMIGLRGNKDDPKEPENDNENDDECKDLEDLEEKHPEFCSMFAAFLLSCGVRPEDERRAAKRFAQLLVMFHKTMI